MTSYCGRLIPNLATISEPLHALTQLNVPWEWGVLADKAFAQVKAALLSDTIMTYFNPRHNTELILDTSPVRLGAILHLDRGGRRMDPYSVRQ